MIGGSIEHEAELFDRDTMIKAFAPQRLNLGGPVFDMQKLLWLNQQYIQNLSEDAFVQHVREEMLNEAKLRSIYPLLRTTARKFCPIFCKGSVFFRRCAGLSAAVGNALQPRAELPQTLTTLCERLENLTDMDTSRHQGTTTSCAAGEWVQDQRVVFTAALVGNRQQEFTRTPCPCSNCSGVN